MSDAGPGTVSRASAVVGELPADLLVVVAFVALAGAVVASTSPGSVPYLLVAVPLLLFVPGYTGLAIAFPARPEFKSTEFEELATLERGPTWLGRLVLSVPASLAALGLVGLCLVGLGQSFDPGPVASVLAGFVLVGTGLAWLRRWRLPSERRLRVPTGWLARFRTNWLATGTTRDLLATVGLIVSVGLLVSSVAFAAGGPAGGETYTSVTLLTENESGDLTVGAFPAELTRGEPSSFVTRLGNHEATDETYALVVRLERLGANGSEVRAARRVATARLSVAVGGTATREFAVTPRTVGPNQRVSVYLYRGDLPETVGPANAYRHAYVGVSVVEPSVAVSRP